MLKRVSQAIRVSLDVMPSWDVRVSQAGDWMSRAEWVYQADLTCWTYWVSQAEVLG